MSTCPDPVAISVSGANPSIAFFIIVGLPSTPRKGSTVKALPAMLPPASVTSTLPRIGSSAVPMKAAMSPNGPPSWPEAILPRASTCPSDAPSSITIPIVQFPSVTVPGKRLKNPQETPARATASRFPESMRNAATPMQVPDSWLGFPPTAHGQMTSHQQTDRYSPCIRHAIRNLPLSRRPRAAVPFGGHPSEAVSLSPPTGRRQGPLPPTPPQTSPGRGPPAGGG